MSSNFIHIQKWMGDHSPSEEELRGIMRAEGLEPMRWANSAHEVYEAHKHDYHKVVYVVSGSITFGFPIVAAPTTLEAGDRLDLPPFILHNAVVGSAGVVCLEAHKSTSM